MNSLITFVFVTAAAFALVAYRRRLVGAWEFDEAARLRAAAYLVRDFILRRFVAMHAVWDRSLGPAEIVELYADPWAMYHHGTLMNFDHAGRNRKEETTGVNHA